MQKTNDAVPGTGMFGTGSSESMEFCILDHVLEEAIHGDGLYNHQHGRYVTYRATYLEMRVLQNDASEFKDLSIT